MRSCGGHLLIFGIGAALYAKHIGTAGKIHADILFQILGQRHLLPVVFCQLSLCR